MSLSARPVLKLLLAVCVGLVSPAAAVAQGAIAALMFKPDHPFSRERTPPVPNYRSDSAWAALPGAGSDKSKASVDVFFVHPTTFLNRAGWNAAFDDPGNGAAGFGVEGTIRAQASVFSSCCRIFAPHYRQATLWSFLDSGNDGMKAIDLAYQDVLRAFDDFIATRNHGRPFILAGHSQGSIHLFRLLQERIAGTPLARQMVAAYVVGAALPREFNSVPVCGAALQLGCVVSWNAVTAAASDRTRGWTVPIWLDRKYRRIGQVPLMCVNPLDWRVDGAADAKANLGVLTRALDAKPTIKAGYAGAKCVNGDLVVDLPKGRADYLPRPATPTSLHIYDYGLFYENLRVNAMARAEAFVARAGGVRTP